MRASSEVRKKVLVVGCGIAGPVAAVALRRAGIDTEIYESQPEPADGVGGYLGLSPNGVGVLEMLGLAETVLAESWPCRKMVFRNHRGKVLGEMAAPTIIVKRGLLNRALRKQAEQRGVAIHFGRRLRSVAVTAEKTVIARFEDGSEAHGDVLLGCDGIHSATRRAIMPEAPLPAYTGVVGSGAVSRYAPASPADGVMQMIFGLRAFFAYWIAPDGEIYWFNNVAEPVEPDRDAMEAIPTDDWRRSLMEVHAGDHEPIGDILRATDGPILRFAIYDLPSLPSWHIGPVGLIGDAAHATSPHAGQGASMAMEDGIEIARCLRDIPDAERAFAAFEVLRRERVERLVREARRSGNQKALSSPSSRWLRDLVLPFFLKKGLKDAEQVFAHRIQWEQRVV